MNTWAKEGHYDCNFLCVCVLGDRSAYSLAKEMSSQMQLTHCVNGFVDRDQDMPTYGQLGCQGFIILDADHRLVSPGTSAFMQVKGLAFDHVEALLEAVCTKQPLPSLCPGEYMVLDDPSPQVKGSQGLVLKVEGSTVLCGFLSGPLRGKTLEVPIGKVKKMAAEGGCGSGGGGCSTGDCASGGCSTGGCASGGCGDGGCGDGKCGTGACADEKCSSGGCAPGAGCADKGDCDGRGGCLDASFVDAALDIASVKVPSMDAEHAECAAVLRNLAQCRTREALEAVRECFDDHFEHEEALFEEFGFGVHANEKLSASKSHAEDHRRILAKISEVLAATAGSTVPVPFIREVLQDFHEHATRYDSQYATPLSAKGAK